MFCKGSTSQTMNQLFVFSRGFEQFHMFWQQSINDRGHCLSFFLFLRTANVLVQTMETERSFIFEECSELFDPRNSPCEIARRLIHVHSWKKGCSDGHIPFFIFLCSLFLGCIWCSCLYLKLKGICLQMIVNIKGSWKEMNETIKGKWIEMMKMEGKCIL